MQYSIAPTIPDLIRNRTWEAGGDYMRWLATMHAHGQDTGYPVEEACAWVLARTGRCYQDSMKAYRSALKAHS